MFEFSSAKLFYYFYTTKEFYVFIQKCFDFRPLKKKVCTFCKFSFEIFGLLKKDAYLCIAFLRKSTHNRW